MNAGTWCILLAGGRGTRLGGLTTDARGRHLPKQFCAFGTGPTLLRRTIERAASVAPRRHVVPVVTEEQRRWWSGELADLPPSNIVVQPEDRGTAPAVLLALLKILSKQPDARIAVLPCDHVVADESVLRRAIEQALGVGEDRVVLLGAVPTRVETDLGWIRHQPAHDSLVAPVESFVEKPEWQKALALKHQGALLNMLILAAAGSVLLDLFRTTAPDLVQGFGGDSRTPGFPSAASVRRVFKQIQTVDLSRDILESAARRALLWVEAVPPCGWCDVGTPERLSSVLVHRRDPAHRFVVGAEVERIGSEYWLG